MSGKHKPPPFDPEIARALHDHAASIVTTMTREDIPRVRAMGVAPAEADVTLHGFFERTEITIARSQGQPIADAAPEIAAVQYFPRAATRPVPVILMLHGGGLVAGEPDSDMPAAAELAAATGCGVVSIDYRLAPEHPYPAALEDAFAALTWLTGASAPAQFDSERVMVMGVSAGGGLAAALALYARDHGAASISGLVLASPMLDARSSSASAQQMVGIGSWDATANAAAWDAYLGAEARMGDLPAYASASHHQDVSGLPPMFIDVGSAETFRDECVDFAKAVWAAGGDAELHVWPGGAHGFEFLAPWAQLSRAARATRISWLRRLLTRV